MADKVLETLISVTDKFSAPILKFEKSLNHAMKPVENLKKGLKAIDRVSGFSAFRTGLGNLRKYSKEALQSITNLGTGIGLVFGAAGFAVAKLNKAVLKLNDIEGGADLFGISVESFQKLEYAAKIAGVPMETIGNSIKKMTVNASKGQKVFSAIGLDAKKIASGAISSEEVILDLSKKFAENGYTAAQKMQIATALFGKSGTDVIALLNEGDEAIKGWFADRESIGLMDDKTAKNAKEYVKNLNKLKADVNAIVVNIGVKFLPVLDKLVKSLSLELIKNKDKYIESFDKLTESVPRFVDSVVTNLPKIFGAIGTLLDLIGKVVDKVGFVGPAFTVAFGGVVVPLLGVVKSIIEILKLPVKFTWSLVALVQKIVVKLKNLIKPFFSFLTKSIGGVIGLLPKFSKAFRFVIPAVRAFGIAFKTALGPVGWLLFAFEYMLPLFDKISEHWSELSFTSFDGIIKSFEILRDLTVEWLDSLGPVGSIIKGIGNIGNKIFGSKVDFSEIPEDTIAEAMKNVPSVDDVGKSGLFKTVTSTRTINNNTRSTIDVNFNNVPKDTVIKRRGFNDPTMFGYSMSPAF